MRAHPRATRRACTSTARWGELRSSSINRRAPARAAHSSTPARRLHTLERVTAASPEPTRLQAITSSTALRSAPNFHGVALAHVVIPQTCTGTICRLPHLEAGDPAGNSQDAPPELLHTLVRGIVPGIYEA